MRLNPRRACFSTRHASRLISCRDGARRGRSRFFASLAAPEYTGLMAAKLDIEGCEFSVVSHLLPVLCAAPRGRAELLAIEWHPVGDGANYSVAPEQHPAVQLSRQLEAPGCNIVSLAWV